MATARQIAANQRNAKKSSGPKTAEGKRNSSGNAVTHGFTAKVHSMDAESHPQYKALRDHYLERYQPASEAEREIIEQMTHSQWNLRRLRLMEKGLMDNLFDKVLADEPDDCEWEETEADDRGEEWDGQLPGSTDDHTRRLAAVFDRGQKTLIRFARYHAHFAAQWWRCYRKLEKLHPSETKTVPSGSPDAPAPPPPQPDKMGSFSQTNADPAQRSPRLQPRVSVGVDAAGGAETEPRTRPLARARKMGHGKIVGLPDVTCSRG